MTRKTYISIPVSQILLGNSRVPAACCPGGPHITLHHLGENRTDEEICEVVEALRAIVAYDPPIKGELTGIGTFYRGQTQVPVILVNSRDACRLWNRVEAMLKGLGIAPSGEYGFIPHVALDSFKGDDGTSYWMAGFRTTRFVAREIHVVTKDKTKQHRQVDKIELSDLPGENRIKMVPPGFDGADHEQFDTTDGGE